MRFQITCMAAGDWSARIEPSGSEYVRRLASNLNLLAAQAQRQLAELQHQRRPPGLVDTLPDPILSVDSQGRLVLLNTPAAALPNCAASRPPARNWSASSTTSRSSNFTNRPATRRPTPPAPPFTARSAWSAMASGSSTRPSPSAPSATSAIPVLRDVSTLAGADPDENRFRRQRQPRTPHSHRRHQGRL